jgi:hypothetical protein
MTVFKYIVYSEFYDDDYDSYIRKDIDFGILTADSQWDAMKEIRTMVKETMAADGNFGQIESEWFDRCFRMSREYRDTDYVVTGEVRRG